MIPPASIGLGLSSRRRAVKDADEATVKSLTGGDTVTARYLYGEHFEFQPQFKLALVTNHLPRIDGSDEVLFG